MKVELFSVLPSCPLQTRPNDGLFFDDAPDESRADMEEGGDKTVLAGFTNFFVLEEFLFDSAKRCNCTMHGFVGWIALDADDLDELTEIMTPFSGDDVAVDAIVFACQQARQHIYQGRFVWAYVCPA